jgi:hypothetical protein
MTKHFLSSFARLTALSFLLTFLFACEKTELKDDPNFAAAKPAPSTLTQVPLIVEVVDGFKISDDGASTGVYTHGLENVSAVLDGNGNFAFNTYSNMTRTTTTPATRWLNFNFDSPVVPGTAGPVDRDNQGRYSMSTLKGATPLQNLTGSIEVGLGGGFLRLGARSPEWNFSFRFNNTDPSTVSRARVTRVSADVWEITGVAANPECAVRGSDGVAKLFYLPFKLILTRKPS